MKSKYRKYDKGGPVGPPNKKRFQQESTFPTDTILKSLALKLDSLEAEHQAAYDALPERMQAGEYYDSLNIKPRYKSHPDDYYREKYKYWVGDPYRIERDDNILNYNNEFIKEQGYTTDDRYYPLSEFSEHTKDAQLEMLSRSLGMLLKDNPVPGASYTFPGTGMESFDQAATVSEDGKYATFYIQPNLKHGAKRGHDYPNARVVVPLREKEEKVKLPYKGLGLSKSKGVTPDMMVDPFPKIYSRKLNQRTGEYVYETSKGVIRKKIGPEDAKFYRMYKSQIDNLRKNR